MPTRITAEALLNACARGDAAAVGRLLPAGGTPLNLSGPRFQSAANSCNFSRTPLMVAATLGHTDVVRMILDRAPNTTVDEAGAYTRPLLSST
jgi:ankyrin repeat protein